MRAPKRIALMAMLISLLPAACSTVWDFSEGTLAEGGATSVGGLGGQGWQPGGAGTGAGLGAGGNATAGAGMGAGGSAAAGAGASGGAAGGTTGAGGSPTCEPPCTSPPNAECYEAVGICDVGTLTCSYTPKASGTSCGATSCGDWSACSWDSQCSNSGGRARTCTDYACNAGTCQASTRQEPDGCSRTVANGTSCTGGYCCSQACVARNSDAHCGSCGIDCGAQSCVQNNDFPGQYSCTCSSNSFCVGAGYGSIATCYTDGGQSLCNCQCPNDAASCANQCAGGGTCADVTGHNYCHY